MAGVWDTPPTEAELKRASVWDAPPTEAELRAAGKATAPKGPGERLGAEIRGMRVPDSVAALAYGGADAIPLGQRATALGSSLALKAAKLLNRGEPWTENLDTTYEGQLRRVREKLAQSEAEQPKATLAGRVLGGGASMAAMPALNVGKGMGAGSTLGSRLATTAARGGQYGAARGAGAAESAPDALHSAAVEGVVGAALGAAGQGLLGEAAPAVAGQLRRVAGNLKVNSLKPTPTVAKAMGSVPGGRTGAGQELLRRDVGGATKAGTAKQIAKQLDEASQGIDDAAAALDASGATPPNLVNVIDEAAEKVAKPLSARPLTKSTGETVENILTEYRGLFRGSKPSFKDALAFRRELGEAIWRNDKFTGTDRALSAQNDALREVYALVNKAIDDAGKKGAPDLAKRFADQNVAVRRLGYASRAAENAADRTAGNNLIDLRSGIMGAAGAAGGLYGGDGASDAAKWGLGSLLLSKYGSQAGARALFGLANRIEGPVLQRALLPGARRAVVAGPRLRLERSPVPRPLYAQTEDE